MGIELGDSEVGTSVIGYVGAADGSEVGQSLGVDDGV